MSHRDFGIISRKIHGPDATYGSIMHGKGFVAAIRYALTCSWENNFSKRNQTTA